MILYRFTKEICIQHLGSQKADSPDICGFYKALLFLAKNCYLSNFLKKLGTDALDVNSDLFEIGKSKICFNFNSL